MLGLCSAMGNPFGDRADREIASVELPRWRSGLGWSQHGPCHGTGLVLTTSTGILQCSWSISELQKWCLSILFTLGKGSLKSRKALGCSLAPAAAGIVFKFFCSFSKHELKPRKMLEDFVVILHSIIKEQVKFPSKSGVRKILSLSLSYLQLICHLNLISG